MSKVHKVTVFENDIRNYVILKHNISSDVYKCGHPGCMKGRDEMEMTIEVGDRGSEDHAQKVPFWMCKEEVGDAVRYIRERRPSNCFGALFTDSSHSTNHFNKYNAQVLDRMLVKEFNELAENRNVLMADFDIIVTENPGLAEEVPFAGREIFRDAEYRATYSNGCLIRHEGETYPIGIKLYSNLWPKALRLGIDKMAESLMDGTGEKVCVRRFNSSIRSMDPEDFIMTGVLSVDPDDYTQQDRVETGIKKCAGYAERRLHGINPRRYFAGIVTREQYDPELRREFINGSRYRSMSDPLTDLSKVDRWFYAVRLAGPTVKRLTNISQEKAWNSEEQALIDSDGSFIPGKPKKKQKKPKNKISDSQSSLFNWY